MVQSAFKSRFCAHMYALQTTLSCFESALNVCNPDILLKVGGAYPEMAAQEKSIDSLIGLAKRDQLDENLSLEATEKCCLYFFSVFGFHFGEEDLTNQAQLIQNGTRLTHFYFLLKQILAFIL